jgi:hypothetical protein
VKYTILAKGVRGDCRAAWEGLLWPMRLVGKAKVAEICTCNSVALHLEMAGLHSVRGRCQGTMHVIRSQGEVIDGLALTSCRQSSSCRHKRLHEPRTISGVLSAQWRAQSAGWRMHI